MVYFWQQIPFCRFLFALLAGILVRIVLPYPLLNTIHLFLIFLIGVLLCLILLSYAGSVYRYSWIAGLFLNGALFIAGTLLVQFNTVKLQPGNVAALSDTTTFYSIRLLEPPVEKEASVKLLAEVYYWKQQQQWRKVKGKVLLYVQKDSSALALDYGSRLIIHTHLSDVKPPQNPHEFDYKTYLEYHKITKQAYIKTSDWKLLTGKTTNPVFQLSYQLRNSLLKLYRDCGFKGEEYAVLSALVVGYTDKLDPDLLTAYSQTGVIHVLSVSGMHVAIVYTLLNFLFIFLHKVKYGITIKTVLLLACLWFYAFLTGLSPSVLRSVSMFSFVVIATGFKLNTNIFNTLAVSCFLLLLYDPFLAVDVGFQLSYLAVLGIVLLQQPLAEQWAPANPALKFYWNLILVSLVAQLFTFPLSLYYFHQFPILFLIANCIVIPLSTIVLYGGIALFFLVKLPFVGPCIAYCLKSTLWLMNALIRWLQGVPYANLQGISINGTELLCIYLLIVLLLLFITTKAYRYFIGALSLFILLLVLQMINSYSQQQQHKLIVYNIPKHAAYDFITGKTDVLIADSSLYKTASLLNRHIKPNWYYCGIRKQQQLFHGSDSSIHMTDFRYKNNFILFHAKHITIIDRNFKLFKLHNGDKVKTDFLILSQNTPVELERLFGLFEFKQLIIDSSNSYNQVQRWQHKCIRLNRSAYCVAEQGAFIVDL